MGIKTPPIAKKRGSLLGILAFLAGVIAAGSATMIGFTSFTAFNPPNWLRILTMVPLPFAIILSVVFGLAGWKTGAGRAWALAGFVLTALSIAAFVVMINVGG